jgi:hypothetical protein
VSFVAAAICHHYIRSVVRASLVVAVAATALCMSPLLLQYLLYLDIDRPGWGWDGLAWLSLVMMAATYVIGGGVGLISKSAEVDAQPGATGLRWRAVSRVLAFLSFLSAAAFVVVVIGNAVTQARMAAQKCQCQCHLGCSLTHGMLQYLDHNKHLPPAFTEDVSGRRMHSWRTLVVLCSGDKDLLSTVNLSEPWNSPHNRGLAALRPGYLACPSDSQTRDNTLTNYFVVVGKKTPFPGPRTTSLADIRGDRSHTILLTEAIGMGIDWMEPRDLVFDQMSFRPDDPQYESISSRHRVPNVGLADGSTHSLQGESPHAVRSMLTLTGNEASKK